MSQNPPVVHLNVALMLCDSSAVLTETLHQLETEDIPFKRLGDRGFVAPAYYVDKIRHRLKEKAIYPAIIGDIVTEHSAEQEPDLEEDELGDERSEAGLAQETNEVEQSSDSVSDPKNSTEEPTEKTADSPRNSSAKTTKTTKSSKK